MKRTFHEIIKFSLHVSWYLCFDLFCFPTLVTTLMVISSIFANLKFLLFRFAWAFVFLCRVGLPVVF